jgi:hypothetical protein
MKKAALAEVIDQPTSELETRVSALEARIEKLDPTPKLETLEPYPVLGNVYSVADLYARNPFVVRGYRNGRILVSCSPGEPERELPIESVIPFSKCRNAETDSEQAHADMYAKMDPRTREFYEGRRNAEIAALKRNELPPWPRPTRQYM